MKRRKLLLVSGAWAALASAGVVAQAPKAPPRIGFLMPLLRADEVIE